MIGVLKIGGLQRYSASAPEGEYIHCCFVLFRRLAAFIPPHGVGYRMEMSGKKKKKSQSVSSDAFGLYASERTHVRDTEF